MYDNEYDPIGGHTKEEADVAFEDLFRELHGDDGNSGGGNGGAGSAGDYNSDEGFVPTYILTPSAADVDSVCAAISYANLKNTLMPSANYIPCASAEIPEGIVNALGLAIAKFPEEAEKAGDIEILTDESFDSDNEIILVGHNNPQISIEGFNKKKIVEIIDCHGLQGFETDHAMNVRIQPLAAVSTIIAHMYRELDILPDSYFSSLLCIGIISATKGFQLENTTQADRLEAVTLASRAGLDISDLAEKIEEAESIS